MSSTENPFTSDPEDEVQTLDEVPAFELATGQTWATGRRKTAVARVRIQPGTGLILVNNRPYEEYFTAPQHREQVTAPFLCTGTAGRFDVMATVQGGGGTGQAGALRLGITRGLMKADPRTEERLRQEGFASRDARKRERDKYGQRGARARYQYSKR